MSIAISGAVQTGRSNKAMHVTPTLAGLPSAAWGAFFIFALLLAVAFIASVGHLQSNQILVRLHQRYAAASNDTDLRWVRPGQDGSLSCDGSAISTNNLLMAYSPHGLHLRMQGLWSPVVDMPTVCIPWAAIACQHSSKFGFYDAIFDISGLDDGTIVRIKIRSTNREFGSCIDQIAVRCCRSGIPEN